MHRRPGSVLLCYPGRRRGRVLGRRPAAAGPGHSAGVLVNYVLGVAGQNAANARALASSKMDRSAFLATVAAQWAQLDPLNTRPYTQPGRNCANTTTASSSSPASISSRP
jgi:hypothetical protein